MFSFAALCGFAFLAGFVDAMVGGGGLIQLPAFFILMPQLSLVQTLASNKTASFLGTAVATVKYIRKVEINWKQLTPTIVSAFVGAFSGALMVSYVHKEQFMPFIITALIIVLFYTIFKKDLGLHHIDKQLTKGRYIAFSIGTGLVIGFYDGLIGPGTGSFLMFAYVMLFGNNFLYASANAKIINCVTGISALSFFLFNGAIVWHIALPIAFANMVGNYAGAHFALRKGSGFIRIFFILIVTALIIKLGYTYL